MYEPDTDDYKNLFSKLFDKERYHKLYTAYGGPIVEAGRGKKLKLSSPVKTDREEFREINSYL